MLYVDATFLELQGMATPKELVDARLKELRMSKAALMKKIGYQTGYQDYHNIFITKPHQLTDEVREKIAAVLGRPSDWLKDGGEFSSLKRERYIREQFELYQQSEVGRTADPETHKILASMQWTGKYLPSKRLYQAVTLAMEERYTAAQLVEAMELEKRDRQAVDEEEGRARERKALPAEKTVRRKTSR